MTVLALLATCLRRSNWKFSLSLFLSHFDYFKLFNFLSNTPNLLIPSLLCTLLDNTLNKSNYLLNKSAELLGEWCCFLVWVCVLIAVWQCLRLLMFLFPLCFSQKVKINFLTFSLSFLVFIFRHSELISQESWMGRGGGGESRPFLILSW